MKNAPDTEIQASCICSAIKNCINWNDIHSYQLVICMQFALKKKKALNSCRPIHVNHFNFPGVRYEIALLSSNYLKDDYVALPSGHF